VNGHSRRKRKAMFNFRLRMRQRAAGVTSEVAVMRAAEIGIQLRYFVLEREQQCPGCNNMTLSVFEQDLCPECIYMAVWITARSSSPQGALDLIKTYGAAQPGSPRES
jgi:hypothetical protein